MKSLTLKKLFLPSILTIGLICGCSDKEVDYNMDTKNEQEINKAALESMSQLKEAETWNDTCSVTTADGQKINMTINADITVPDTDSMSVVEVEETVIDADFKKHLLDNFFAGNDVYYYDAKHQTRSGLERLIKEQEDAVDAAEQKITDTKEEATMQEFLTDAEFYVEDAKEYAREQAALLQQYQTLLETATDDYIVATEYDSCNKYLGYREEIPFVVTFQEDAKEGFPYIQIAIDEMYVDKECYYGPEELKNINADNIFRCADKTEVGANTCTLSKEEARELADRFIEQIGRSNQVCSEEADLTWKSFDDTGNTKTVTYGYRFIYGIGVDDVAFREYGDYQDYSEFYSGNLNTYSLDEHMEVDVTDKGIISIQMYNPLTVNSITKQVELLPLSTIQSIMKDEVMEHTERYDFSQYKYFHFMELIYFRVKNKDIQGNYSYIPTWRLCQIQKPNGIDRNAYYHPILVNAIDGSVIYVEDELFCSE